MRRLPVGSSVSSLAVRANRLYIGGDAFFAVVNVEVRSAQRATVIVWLIVVGRLSVGVSCASYANEM